MDSDVVVGSCCSVSTTVHGITGFYNLLNSTEIVTVFLDNDLHVRRFTTGADKLFKRIPADVGRPLSDIVTDLLYPTMAEEAREVLRTLVFSEKQIAVIDRRWFLLRVMPYRTMEGVIDGVVITFRNIIAAKALEPELREENARLKKLLQAEEQRSKDERLCHKACFS